jgi:hypothetical protein
MMSASVLGVCLLSSSISAQPVPDALDVLISSRVKSEELQLLASQVTAMRMVDRGQLPAGSLAGADSAASYLAAQGFFSLPVVADLTGRQLRVWVTSEMFGLESLRASNEIMAGTLRSDGREPNTFGELPKEVQARVNQGITSIFQDQLEPGESMRVKGDFKLSWGGQVEMRLSWRSQSGSHKEYELQRKDLPLAPVEVLPNAVEGAPGLGAARVVSLAPAGASLSPSAWVDLWAMTSQAVEEEVVRLRQASRLLRAQLQEKLVRDGSIPDASIVGRSPAGAPSWVEPLLVSAVQMLGWADAYGADQAAKEVQIQQLQVEPILFFRVQHQGRTIILPFEL